MALHSATATDRSEDTMNDLSLEDIIDRPHYEPKHPRMPLANRAAQFAPFAALTGHDAAIAETARPTASQIDLSTDEQEKNSLRLRQALETGAPVTIRFFQPDARKSGGSYRSVSGTIRKIDELSRLIIMTDSQPIPLDSLIDIGEIVF